MAKSELFANLPDIEFAVRDPVTIESSIITAYEKASGRTLARGDPVRLFLETIALVIIQQRQVIDYAAKMNLLAYAEGDYLDHIGAQLGVTRLTASAATCMLRFTFSTANESVRTIPAGTRATNNTITFATLKAVEVPAGANAVEVEAQCTVSGTVGNGFLPGQINKLVDVLPWECAVENITTSNDGAETENDENFRERIQLAPESFSNAGSKGAYIYYTRTAHPGIVDVAVVGPSDSADVEPGNVFIYPLMVGGELPSQEILNLVDATCSADDVRPLGIYVHVQSPTVRSFDLDMTYWIDSANATSAIAIQEAVESAISSWLSWQRSALGRDLNPDELTKLVKLAGAKWCEIRSPLKTVVYANEVAVLNTKNVIYGGLQNG